MRCERTIRARRSGVTVVLAAVAVAASVLGAGAARAQDVALPEPATQPSKQEGEPEIALDVDREIDLANVVTSAAKGVTTVQEAPAIITIITADEIKSRGFKFINEALATIPGWLEAGAIGNQAKFALVRGLGQAVLLLRDGVSMFDPAYNIAATNRSQSLETFKRIEVVTGPGGVLWGANSFLGVVNIIGKDAEDVNGLEVGGGYGDGPGNTSDIRAYAMFGKVLFGGRLKIFQHVSYENYTGATFTLPQYIASSPAPQPPGPSIIGGINGTEADRSYLVIIDGKYSLGPFSLYYQFPFGEMREQLGFAQTVTNNIFTTFDRFGVLEYKSRFLKNAFGVTVKGYYSQFVRSYSFLLDPPSVFFPKGLRFDNTPGNIQRFGATFDADAKLPVHLSLLFGGEAFRESISGKTVTFTAPDPVDLPVACPVNPDGTRIPLCPKQFVNDVDRIVAAGYVDLQWRPFQTLTADGGLRLQKGLGTRPYDLTYLYSGALVWNFLPDYHAKLNYATGFRPPVFNNTDVPVGALNYAGSINLKSETSQSFQGELNARLLKNVRKVRELLLRLDYSYTFIDNVIVERSNIYSNAGKRAIHSIEAYSKLYLTGDHFIQASYTFLNSTSTDSGYVRVSPNNWFTIGAVFNLVHNVLDVNTNLNIFGASEDFNRYASATAGLQGASSKSYPSDLTVDRLVPIALLQVGARLRLFKEHVSAGIQLYNVLNQHYYYTDYLFDVTPSVDTTPLPAPGFNFMTTLSYHP